MYDLLKNFDRKNPSVVEKMKTFKTPIPNLEQYLIPENGLCTKKWGINSKCGDKTKNLCCGKTLINKQSDSLLETCQNVQLSGNTFDYTPSGLGSDYTQKNMQFECNLGDLIDSDCQDYQRV